MDIRKRTPQSAVLAGEAVMMVKVAMVQGNLQEEEMDCLERPLHLQRTNRRVEPSGYQKTIPVHSRLIIPEWRCGLPNTHACKYLVL